MIALLAIMFLPFVIIYNWDYQYSINNVMVSNSDFTIGMGYEVYMDYVEFFEIDIPYLYFYFNYNNYDLINLEIRFLPIQIDWISSESENNETQQETFSVEFYTLNEVISLNTQETGDNISDLNRSSPDIIEVLNILDLVVSGLDTAFGLWSFYILLIGIALTSNFCPGINIQIKILMLLTPIIVCIGSLLAELFIQQYTKEESFWYFQ